jgi:manganese transport protein
LPGAADQQNNQPPADYSEHASPTVLRYAKRRIHISLIFGALMTFHQPSLPEVHRSIPIPQQGWRKLLAYAGPGYLVSVGYMDPGNWATDIAGGSRFGYALLSVIVLSNLMAMLLQALCVRLGIATGRDLAQLCREQFRPWVSWVLWILCELAIVACDLAELLGSAIALKLLFGLPMVAGVCLMGLDVFVLLLLQRKGFRYFEALIITLVSTVALCFSAQLILARPSLGGIVAGLAPPTELLRNPEMLYLAIGIMGATVMPHNLYLHSAIVQTRAWRTDRQAEAIKFSTIDSTIALGFALLINASILIVAAATFHVTGNHQVTEIETAYQMLSPILGTSLASTLFAGALLASGQSSTLTATLAGQIVMEGFLQVRLPGWVRRLATRGLAMVPALVAVAFFGEGQTGQLLVLSQVVLSLQLPFAVVPLIIFTGNRRLMGQFTSPPWLQRSAWAVAIVIIGLNLVLLTQMVWH